MCRRGVELASDTPHPALPGKFCHRFNVEPDLHIEGPAGVANVSLVNFAHGNPGVAWLPCGSPGFVVEYVLLGLDSVVRYAAANISRATAREAAAYSRSQPAEPALYTDTVSFE